MLIVQLIIRSRTPGQILKNARQAKFNSLKTQTTRQQNE